MREARLDVRELDEQRGTRVTDAWLRGVATTFTGLTKLDLERCTKITDAGLEHVGKLSNLATFHLSDCTGITDAGLAHVGKLSNLTTLDLSYCNFTDAGLEHLARLTSLTLLDLSDRDLPFDRDRPFPSAVGRDITDAGLAHLQDLLPWCDVRRI